MKRVVLIHGYTSSPLRQKYQIILRELTKRGIKCSIPALPGDEHPRSKIWLEILDTEIKRTSEAVVLVGHSLGSRAVLLYLDKYEYAVDSVILISAFSNDYKNNSVRRDVDYADFFDYPVNTNKIKKLAKKFIVAHSKDDDAIDFQQGVAISRDLGAQLITYNNMGHFGGEDRAEINAQAFLELILSVYK